MDSCFFPIYFVFLDVEKDVSLILGRTFLATDRALIDVEQGKLVLKFQEEKVAFHVSKLCAILMMKGIVSHSTL